jgi:hypothetical protein
MMGYGYENAAGDRISALIDMINGGGPGRSGGTFEGGGILSLLANAVAKPYGSVRERPGHTPVGAAAPPRMEVLRPVATGAGVGEVERGVLSNGEGRTFREEDFAVLGRLHPEVAKLFSGVRVGDPLPPSLAMYLNAARAVSAAEPVMSFGDTAKEFRSPSFGPTAEERRNLSFRNLSFGPTAEDFRNLFPEMGNPDPLQFQKT